MGFRFLSRKDDPRPGRDPNAQEHNIPSQASDHCPENMTQDLRGISVQKMTQDLGGILMPRSITSLHRLRITVQKK
jgi:hypothetical protein